MAEEQFKSVGELAERADDEEDVGVSVIPGSLCMACGKDGTTRMMTTKIPHFREIIVCSFECDSCGETNNEVTFGGEIQEKGCRYELHVENEKDLGRQIIKSDTASVSFPDMEFEIPARSQRGGITTIEGVLHTAMTNLQMFQKERMEQHPEVGIAVGQVIAKLVLRMHGSDYPFTLVLDDPAGNSFVENPLAPSADPQLQVTHYTRTPTQDLAVGLQVSEHARETGILDDTAQSSASLPGESVQGAQALLSKIQLSSVDETTTELGRREVIRMQTPCPHCHASGESLTCLADIPHFKEIIIMAFDCSECGYRTNEIKAGGGVPRKGQKTTLRVTSMEDFKRDVLKSASAIVCIKEIDLEASQSSLGGLYTTVEGLLAKVFDTMTSSAPFSTGDSADAVRKNAWTTFTEKVGQYVRGDILPFTIEIKDPLASSFIGTLGEKSPDEDEHLTVVDYNRSWDEDEEFGLHDIQVDDYGDERPDENPNLAVTSKRWGPDHPHESGKGCDDNLPPPHREEHETVNTSLCDESGIEFQPCESFSGARAGFIFKMGSQGLGYYEDSKKSSQV